MTEFKVFTGKSTTEQTGNIAEKLHDFIWEHCQGMPIPTIVGILEIVKIELMEDNR